MRESLPPGKHQGNFRWPFISYLNVKHFIFVAVLIIALPLLREWRILLHGEKVMGELITPYEAGIGYSEADRNTVVRNVICYEYQGRVYKSFASQFLDMLPGEQVTLKLHPADPHRYIIASARGFFLHRRSIAIVMVLLIWTAIYATMMQIQEGSLFSRR